jgi:hypothetical protein
MALKIKARQSLVQGHRFFCLAPGPSGLILHQMFSLFSFSASSLTSFKLCPLLKEQDISECLVSFGCCIFFNTGVWTQDLAFARQALYYWSHTPALLYFFSNRVSCFCAPLAWTTIFVHSWNDRHIPPCPTYWLKWCLTNFLPGLASRSLTPIAGIIIMSTTPGLRYCLSWRLEIKEESNGKSP